MKDCLRIDLLNGLAFLLRLSILSAQAEGKILDNIRNPSLKDGKSF